MPPPPPSLVTLGTGLGVYALVTAFHSHFGSESRIVTRVAIDAMRHSRAARVIEVGAGASDADLIDAALEQGRELAARDAAAGSRFKPLLIVNEDALVELLDEYRTQLEEVFDLPIASRDALRRVVDKAEFAQLCSDVDIPAPLTEVIDFSQEHEPEPTKLEFPVVLKVAKASDLFGVSVPDCRKVYFLVSQRELDSVVGMHRDGGFRGRMVVQELIPGDDTAMWSITAYRDARGVVTLRASAQVLLEEHTPEALGRPAAMMTVVDDSALAAAERLLHAVDYRGFANFDLKRDPRDGILKFLELNPRMGRNHYYVSAAGANVAQFPVADVRGEAMEPVTVRTQRVYSLVPLWLVRRYVRDRELWARVKSAARSGVANPWKYRPDGVRAILYAHAVALSHVRKFRQHYPHPTDTGF